LLDSGPLGSFEQIPRAGHIALVNLSGISRPEAVIGRNVKYAIDGAKRALKRSGIAQIAFNALSL
jgi:hypothetical protein